MRNLKYIIGGASIIAIAGALVYTKPWQKGKTADSQDDGRAKLIAESQKDSDGDGLKDWEEALWGTNPNLKDSDGDGIGDKEEAVVTAETPTSTNSSDDDYSYSYSFDSNLGKTLTDKIGQNFAVNYLEAKAAGDFSEATAGQITNNLISQIQTPEIYRDIKIESILIVDPTRKNIDIYTATVNNIFTSVTKAKFKEVEIISTTLQNETTNDLTALSPYIANYKDLRYKLQTMQVPSIFRPLHLKALQDVDTMVRSLSKIQTLGKDPLALLGEYARYGAAVQELLTTVENGSILANSI